MTRNGNPVVVAFTLQIAAGCCLAADLIVEENGVLPNYATIQSALDAASPSDRIFVKEIMSGIQS